MGLDAALIKVEVEGKDQPAPIAAGILLASERIFGGVEDAIIMLELSLDGSLRHISGVLPMASIAGEQGYHALCVPAEDAAEASRIGGLEVDTPPIYWLWWIISPVTPVCRTFNPTTRWGIQRSCLAMLQTWQK